MSDRRSLEAWLRHPLTRRSLLVGGAALCGVARAHVLAQGTGDNAPRWTAYPFSLGVASGDPSDDGVVLWTRLAPDPLNGGGMTPAPVDVAWEVATDDKMSQVVKRGTAKAEMLWGHSVHVEVSGLEADRWYWYQFRAGGVDSPLGRTRTLPKEGANVDRLRFGFASCQHFETGLFTAYEHMAKEDLDVVFHLGDYIYEGAGIDHRTRKHVGGKLLTIEDYRNRYAQYKSDAHLQAAHAQFPWCVTWDDHEVENNYAAHLSERSTVTPPQFLEQRAFAYHAYYEHMPLRRSSLPKGAALQLYRDFNYGSLASFFILDTRQFRTDQPCMDGNKVPCPETFDEKATLLGEKQEEWLFRGLRGSKGQWNVLPQQIMMARVDQFAGEEQRFSMDQWPGYDASLKRIMQFFGTAKPSNPIVLTGDIHTNWVNDLKLDFADEKSPIVASEFVVTSITSGGDGADPAPRIADVLKENPFVKFYSNRRGYAVTTVTPKELRTDYQQIEFVTRAGGGKTTSASFIVEDGRPGAKKV
jgi:alkaline phosphatase D